MSTLANRPNPALLVVDVQNAVVAGAHERDAFVANVRSLVEKARRIVAELTPCEAEPLVEKNYRDSFEDRRWKIGAG